MRLSWPGGAPVSARGRRRGEGSIYQDGDGRWRASYFDLTGRRRYLTRKTRPATVAALRQALDARDTGIHARGHALTVEEWLGHWLDTIASAKVAPLTLAGYRQKLAHHVIPRIGRVRLEQLDAEHLEETYRAAALAGLAPATVLQVHRILARALKVAHQRGRAPRNVALLVDAPSVQRGEVLPLTAAEARRVLAAATGRREAARWSVALALGLRQGEALGLTWDDVDLDAGTVTVRRQLQRLRPEHGCPAPSRCSGRSPRKCPASVPGRLVLRTTKTRKSRRTIALPETLRGALREHRQEQLAERLEEGPNWVGFDQDGQRVQLVFCHRNGRAWEPKADYQRWVALVETAGVRRARLHDARHTAATLMLLQGVPAKVVSEILGHSQITLTLDTYSHVVPELSRRAAAGMDDALWGSAVAARRARRARMSRTLGHS